MAKVIHLPILRASEEAYEAACVQAKIPNSLYAELRLLRLAVQLDPRNHRALNNLSVRASRDSAYGQALSYIVEALKHDPENMMYTCNMARIYVGQEQYNLALGAYYAVLMSDSGNVQALIGAAWSHTELKEYRQALDIIGKAFECELDGDDIIILDSLHKKCMKAIGTDTIPVRGVKNNGYAAEQEATETGTADWTTSTGISHFQEEVTDGICQDTWGKSRLPV